LGENILCVGRRWMWPCRQPCMDFNRLVAAIPQAHDELAKQACQAVYGEKVLSELTARLSDIPPIGILLCTDKNHALAEYARAGMDNSLFVSKYLLELPKKEEMQAFIKRQVKEIGDVG
ncbi:PDDEXK nuclease domain-containing protein, partial [Nitrosococcus oceani]